MTNESYVEGRLSHGSLCSVCPLNGGRKVGKDGSPDAEVWGIAEAPGEDEERWGRARGQKYGTPLVGKSGYRMRIENLAPAGLVDVTPDPARNYPRLGPPRAFLTNVVMCRPPGNKIDSPAGRVAVRCCANSLRWVLREALAKNPNRTIVAVGATAASFLRRRKTKIDAHRGRVRHFADPLTELARVLEPEPEADIMKFALRGKKPTEEWWPFQEKVLKAIISAQRRGVAKAAKRAPEEWNTKRTFSISAQGYVPLNITTNHEAIIKLVLTKQRAALRKAVKG